LQTIGSVETKCKYLWLSKGDENTFFVVVVILKIIGRIKTLFGKSKGMTGPRIGLSKTSLSWELNNFVKFVKRMKG